MARPHTRSIVKGLAVAAGLFLSQVALAQLPVLQPEQRLIYPPDPAPQVQGDTHVRFGWRVYTDGSTAIVTVDRGRAVYAYVKNAAGRWIFQQALTIPGGYATSVAAVRGRTALIAGVVDSVEVSFVFYRTGGHWVHTQTLPGTWSAIGENYVAIGDPNFNDAHGGVVIYDAVGAGTYAYNTTLEAEGSVEGYLTGIYTQISGDTIATFTPGIGAVTVFVRNGGVWSQQALLTRTDGLSPGYFSLDNNRVVIASEGKFEGQANNPQVFVRSSGSWALEQELVHPYEAEGHLDFSIALSGKRIVVGDTATDSTFLYERNGSAWSAVAELPKAKPVTCRLDSPEAFVTPFVAAQGRFAFTACPSTPTPDPRFEGRVLVYQIE